MRAGDWDEEEERLVSTFRRRYEDGADGEMCLRSVNDTRPSILKASEMAVSKYSRVAAQDMLRRSAIAVPGFRSDDARPEDINSSFGSFITVPKHAAVKEVHAM